MFLIQFNLHLLAAGGLVVDRFYIELDTNDNNVKKWLPKLNAGRNTETPGIQVRING